MSTKLFIFSCVLSFAFVASLEVKADEEKDEPANYVFNYAVNEPLTDDVKNHEESAKDGAVSGFYSLIDADGFKRIVHYIADDVNGFQADVKREPLVKA